MISLIVTSCELSNFISENSEHQSTNYLAIIHWHFFLVHSDVIDADRIFEHRSTFATINRLNSILYTLQFFHSSLNGCTIMNGRNLHLVLHSKSKSFWKKRNMPKDAPWQALQSDLDRLFPRRAFCLQNDHYFERSRFAEIEKLFLSTRTKLFLVIYHRKSFM